MTLDEKLGQLYIIMKDFDSDTAYNSLAQHGLGVTRMHHRDPEKTIDYINRLNKRVIAQTEFILPPLIFEEGLHGFMHPSATSFPVPIALAGTFDTDLNQRIFEATAKEARSLGVNLLFGPVLDVGREQRWGRLPETYGEDPYLIGEMGVAAVNGMQGGKCKVDNEHVAVCLKHFCAYGEPQGGLNCSPVASGGERNLRDIHLYPFKEVIQRTHVHSVMPSYNEIDGLPSHKNKWLLQDMLRDDIGFTGFTISDADAIPRMLWDQRVVPDTISAAEAAFKAGVNLELFNPHSYQYLKELLAQGRITERLIDERVRPIIRTKLELDLQKNEQADVMKAKEVLACEEHRAIAYEAACKSMVMLENEANLAPLNPEKIDRIALIGPNIMPDRLGNYSTNSYYVNVHDGIKDHCGDKVDLVYAEGCKLYKPWQKEEIELTGFQNANYYNKRISELEKRSISEAVSVAKTSDVIVLAFGGARFTTREAFMGQWGDNHHLKLLGAQVELINELKKLNKPIVGIIMGGHPFTNPEIYESLSTIYQCWYLGSEAGNAIASTLFGKNNPSGKLSVSMARSVGHLPIYYNFKMAPVSTSPRKYEFGKRQPYHYEPSCEPLYPFGYGLSYTQFDISASLDKHEILTTESVKVKVSVKNTGKVAGDEVVQMYIRDVYSSVTRPVMELKGFQRVSLLPGEEKIITMTIMPKKLALYDSNMKYMVEPGDFDIYIGNSSDRDYLQRLALKVK